MQSQSGNTGSSGTATQNIELGWQVYDAMERPIGNVADVERERGQLRVDGRPAGFEFFEVPLSAVKQVKAEDVYLSLQLDPSSAGDSSPRWTNGAGTAGTASAASVSRASSAPRTAASSGTTGTARATSDRWSPTIENPNIVKVGESEAHDVPVWTEGTDSSWSSYAPWVGAVGLSAAGAAGYYWWLQSRRRSPFERALDYATGAVGYAGGAVEPVYDRARERPAWAAALALAAAAAPPLIAYLRSTQEESTLDTARRRAQAYSPFGQPTWRDTAASWWESAPPVRDTAAAWWEAAPSLGGAAAAVTASLPTLGSRRETWRDYLTREEDSDWVTWPLGAALLGMVVGALWYLLKSDSDDDRASESIRDIMTRHPEVIRPDATVFEAAALMRRLDVGAVPVCDGSRLQGMLTDRDIAIRSAADGKDPHLTLVRDVMTADVTWAFEDEPVERAADLMRQHQIRRLPIVSRDKHLVGVVSLGDLAVEVGDDRLIGSTLERVSEPSRPGR